MWFLLCYCCKEKVQVNVSKCFVTFLVDGKSDSSQVMILQYWDEVIYVKTRFLLWNFCIFPLVLQRFEEDALYVDPLHYRFIVEDNGFLKFFYSKHCFVGKITYKIVSNVLDKQCRIESYGKFTLSTVPYFFSGFILYFHALIVFFLIVCIVRYF